MAQWFVPWFGQVQYFPTPRCGVPTDEGCNQPLSSGPKTHLNTTAFCLLFLIPFARNLHSLEPLALTKDVHRESRAALIIIDPIHATLDPTGSVLAILSAVMFALYSVCLLYTSAR